MSEYLLHCFGESGNAYKAALMLELSKADWEAKFVDFFKGETRTPEFRQDVNEMGEAPVLEHKGETLTQSGVILEYLSEQLGTFGWQTPEERREILRWIYFDNHKFTSYNATLRFMLTFMKTGENDVTEFMRARAEGAMSVVEKHLGGNEWMAAGRPTIADLSLVGYMFYDDELGVDLEDYPNICAWRERIRALPGWKGPYDLMQRGA